MTELNTIVTGRSDLIIIVFLLGSLITNIVQQVLIFKKDSCFGRVSELERRLEAQATEMAEQNKNITLLQQKVFELSKENAELKGLTEILRDNQKMKEVYFNQLKNNT